MFNKARPAALVSAPDPHRISSRRSLLSWQAARDRRPASPNRAPLSATTGPTQGCHEAPVSPSAAARPSACPHVLLVPPPTWRRPRLARASRLGVARPLCCHYMAIIRRYESPPLAASPARDRAGAPPGHARRQTLRATRSLAHPGPGWQRETRRCAPLEWRMSAPPAVGGRSPFVGARSRLPATATGETCWAGLVL